MERRRCWFCGRFTDRDAPILRYTDETRELELCPKCLPEFEEGARTRGFKTELVKPGEKGGE